MSHENASLLVGCDVHEKTLLLFAACGREAPVKRAFPAGPAGRARMIAFLRDQAKRAGADHIVFAYEAGPHGFGLYDELTDAGIRCHVLAPSRMARSVKDRKEKTDEKDAARILQCLRNHHLAGEPLPEVWVPDPSSRADRQLVRQRQSVAQQVTVAKVRITAFLKANGVAKPSRIGKNWTASHRRWLADLARRKDAGWRLPLRLCLQSLLRRLREAEQELMRLDHHVARLSQTRRYRAPAQALMEMPGVGLVTAMVFLTELGDLSRFANRRRLAAYLGLTPSCHETGERGDRKGHITRQGPPRVRRVLCQAAWAWCRCDPRERARLLGVSKGKKDRKKIAVVAQMRRLAIRMWHTARAAQPAGEGRPSPAAGGSGE